MWSSFRYFLLSISDSSGKILVSHPRWCLYAGRGRSRSSQGGMMGWRGWRVRRQSPQKLKNTSSYLTVIFACNFAHQHLKWQKIQSVCYTYRCKWGDAPLNLPLDHPSILGMTVVVFNTLLVKAWTLCRGVKCHFNMLLCRMQTSPHSWSWLCDLARRLSYKKLMVWNRCCIHCCVVIS